MIRQDGTQVEIPLTDAEYLKDWIRLLVCCQNYIFYPGKHTGVIIYTFSMASGCCTRFVRYGFFMRVSSGDNFNPKLKPLVSFDKKVNRGKII